MPPRTNTSSIICLSSRCNHRPYLVWDLKQGGLAVRVEPTGYKSWKAIYSHHGGPRWYHIGKVDAIGLTQARTIANEVMYKVAKGADPQAERKDDRSTGTFEELAKRYVDDTPGQGVSTG